VSPSFFRAEPPRADVSAEGLARALEANVLDRIERLGRAPAAELRDDGDLLRYATGLPLPLLNGALRARLAEDGAGRRVAEALAWFRERRLPMTWFVGPSSQPAGLGEHLAANGLVRGGPPGMAVDLHALNDALPHPAGLEVVPVEDEQGLRQWIRVIVASFRLPPEVELPLAALYGSLGLGWPARLYLGLWNGQPVATSKLLLSSGVAGIYWVGTLPEARGRGIGTAITLAPLREARAQGYRIGILEAFPLGINVYRRIGFRECGKIDRYAAP